MAPDLKLCLIRKMRSLFYFKLARWFFCNKVDDLVACFLFFFFWKMHCPLGLGARRQCRNLPALLNDLRKPQLLNKPWVAVGTVLRSCSVRLQVVLQEARVGSNLWKAQRLSQAQQ